ncbi:hypothetical protein Hanom_Chr12g01132731 [Helianthus anomalus]
MSPSCVHGRTHPVWEASGNKVEESMNEVVTCVQQRRVNMLDSSEESAKMGRVR